MKLPKGIRIRNGSYVAYVTKDGKPIRKAVGRVGCVTPKQAAQERADLEKLIRDGLYPPKQASTPKESGTTCVDLWEAYKQDCRNRGVRRMDRLELAWSHLKPIFGSKAANSVRPRDIADYITSRREAEMANATCNREIAILKSSFRHGSRLELVERIPAFPRKLKEAKPRQGFVEEAQYKTLMNNAREPWLRCFVALGFNFGLRKGELLALQVHDADLLEGWLTIADSKNDEGRRIALTKETATLLAACIRGKQHNAFIFTRENGSRVVAPRKAWYALCVRSGLGQFEKRPDGKTVYEGLQMHDLRRSAVRRMRRRGVQEKICMAISGHKTRSVFDRYNITVECDVEQAVKLLEPGAEKRKSLKQKRMQETGTKTGTTACSHS